MLSYDIILCFSVTISETCYICDIGMERLQFALERNGIRRSQRSPHHTQQTVETRCAHV